MIGVIVALRTKCGFFAALRMTNLDFAPIILKVSPARKICESAYKIDVGAVGNDAAVEAHVKELANGFSAVFAVVEGALVSRTCRRSGWPAWGRDRGRNCMA